MRAWALLILAGAVVAGGCKSTTPPEARSPGDAGAATVQEVTPEAAPAPAGMREVFPRVRVDAARRVVEFDGVVPIDCHDPQTPDVFLELVACTKGTREHESLVMTEARPSHVHAALLLAGFESGTPGGLGGRAADGSRVEASAPSGDRVRVTIVYTDDAGAIVEADPRAMIVHADSGARFETAGWVFGGSAFVEHRGQEFYDADGTGLLIGLATFGAPHLKGPTFGGETIGLAEVFSPEAAVAEPVWIADAASVPAYRTRVVVRLTPP